MKKTFIIIIGVFLILFAACTTQPQEQESIDKVVLERYGMFTMPEFGQQIITITSEGMLYETFYYNGNKTGETFTEFTGNEFEELTNSIESNNFFELEDKYVSEVQVADVGDGKITVTKGLNSKTVEVAPFISEGNPSEIRKIIEALYEAINKGELPTLEETQTLTFQGMQCESEPWEEWYKENGHEYIQEPTQSQLIIDYYGSQGINIVDLREFQHENVCQACSVCPDITYYEVDVSQDNVEVLNSDGWVNAQ